MPTSIHQFGQVELVCACIIEQFPKQLSKRKEVVVLITCGIMMLLGLSCVTEVRLQGLSIRYIFLYRVAIFNCEKDAKLI